MFEELYSAITKKSFDTFIDQERKLILYQPPYLIGTNQWRIEPDVSISTDVNKFYDKFNEGIQGTKEECLELIKDYQI